MPIVSTKAAPPAAPTYTYSGRYVGSGSPGGGRGFQPYLRFFPSGPTGLDPASMPGAAGPGPGGPSGGGPYDSPGFPVFGTDAVMGAEAPSPVVPGGIPLANSSAAVAVSTATAAAGGQPAGSNVSVNDGPGPEALPAFGTKMPGGASVGSERSASMPACDSGANDRSKYWPWLVGGLAALGLLAALSDSNDGGGAFR